MFNELKNKKILILGFGKEGKSTYTLLRHKFPDKQLGIADFNKKIENSIKDKKLTYHTGKEYLNAIEEYDIVFKSPGILLNNLNSFYLDKVTSQTDKFLESYGGQTIGVTGTKGKSTTATLIYHFLKTTNKNVVLLGNIGIPSFDKLDKISKNTIIVYELSAHQLQYVNHSPKVAVLLNIFPEHLDHFSSFEQYEKSKLNINKFQKPDNVLIINKDLKNKIINTKPEIVFTEKRETGVHTQLKGAHNLENIDAAIKAVEIFGITREQALASLKTFSPLPHRLEYIGNYGGIDFYNDSIATVPEATIAAVKAIGNVNTIILGGFDRGLDYAEMLCFLRDNKSIKNMIFTGQAGEVMYNMITTQPKNGKGLFKAKDMEEIFKIIKENTVENSVCLLSPAAASYDSYHNFEHRGEIFKKYAKEFMK